MAVVQTGDNKWAVCKFIVDPVLGTSTTITAAMAAASSGDVIAVRQGTYTESFTIPAGVTLTTMGGGEYGGVTIIGTVTMTGAGSSSIFGMRLQTNSAFAVAVTGSAASVLNIENCYINCSNNTGISYTSSNASSVIFLNKCVGDIGTTGISLYASSSTGSIQAKYCGFSNTGASSTVSSFSAGILNIDYSYFLFPLSYSSSSTASAIEFSDIEPSVAGVNATALTTSGTGTIVLNSTFLSSGTATALSVGAGTIVATDNLLVSSSNVNALDGAGTIKFGLITYISSSSLNNVTTKTSLVSNLGSLTLNTPLTVPNGGSGLATLTANSIQVGNGTGTVTQLAVGATGTVLTGVTASNPAFSATPSVTSITLSSGTALSAYVEGTFTPTMVGAVAGITTYSNQLGFYTRIGNVVNVNAYIQGSAATGTGNITYGALPFTVKNAGGYAPVGSFYPVAARTWPALSTEVLIAPSSNTITAVLPSFGNTVAGANTQMQNIAFLDIYTISYQI